jgi:quercetin dioxygenase-like cupin family protein
MSGADSLVAVAQQGLEMDMRRMTFSAACVMASAAIAGACGTPARAVGRAAVVVLDNVRVRVSRTTSASLAGAAHGPGVAIPIEDGRARKKGEAYWATGKDNESRAADDAPLVFVEPKPFTQGAPPPPAGSKPGEATFVGMSFKTLFENESVTAMRARMDVGASEGLHTHGSDTLVIHLSGGEIEDTANGTTIVNRWKPGDVEFESRGSSHSARNIGQAVDVVLVALK